MVLAQQGLAGTVFITHWDTAHAGGSPAETSRFMVKFAYLRVVHPRAYTVETRSVPECVASNYTNATHPAASHHVFSWLRGLPKLSATEVVALAQPFTSAATAATMTSVAGERSIANLISSLNQQDQTHRIAAIYALAAIGLPAVESLLADLSQHSRRPRLLMQGDSGALVTDNEEWRQQPHSLNWSEDAVVCEDAAYALAAMEPSATLATVLLATVASQRPELPEDEWMILNCVFALGEMGCAVLDRCVAIRLLLISTVLRQLNL